MVSLRPSQGHVCLLCLCLLVGIKENETDCVKMLIVENIFKEALTFFVSCVAVCMFV